jgi:hypothetical protein
MSATVLNLRDRGGELLASRFWDECRALERDGALDDRDVLAFANHTRNPQSGPCLTNRGTIRVSVGMKPKSGSWVIPNKEESKLN